MKPVTVKFVLLLAYIANSAFPQEAELRMSIYDAVSGRPTPCTVTLTDANGKVVIENESFKSGFRSSGHFSKRLPPGPTQIRVTRGFETQAAVTNLDLVPGRVTEITLKLQRLVDLRQRGWFAGDSHVHMLHGERTAHVDFDYVALAAHAEDLHYMSLAQAWTLEHPTPEGLEHELQSRSSPNCILAWNLEAPKNYYQGDAGRCLGHCWNLGMQGRTGEGSNVIQVLMEASAWDYEASKPSYANFESQQLIHAQGGAVFYTHPARWWTGAWGGKGPYPKVERMRVSNLAVELPLDTLIGPTFDGLDVLTGAGEHAANARSFELWSLLLNHGYQLAATASSDACFDRPGGAVPGIVRTYTFVPEGFSLSNAARASAAGKTFITSGPLLLATIDGQPPGSRFRVGENSRLLELEAWASGADLRSLSRLEILRNGKSFKEIPLKGQTMCKTNMVLQEERNAWYVVRVLGEEPEKQTAMTGAFYFLEKSYSPPPPVRAEVDARVIDSASGELLPATLTEVTFQGTIGREGRRHTLKNGQGHLSIPGTVRLRAEAKNYQPLTLSPFLDNPELVQTVTGLAEPELVDWNTFERIRDQLSRIELTFRMVRTQR